MYCINCGVKLADTEKSCPLCGTVVYHPDLQQPAARPLYPKGRDPEAQPHSKVFQYFLLILFAVPLLLCFIGDLQGDWHLDWFGYVAGGLLVGYILLPLPLWFHKPNPVIFVPCGFAAILLYLLYIDLVNHGGWFLPFAFPVTGVLALIVCALVTLLRYLKRGRLYAIGGFFLAFSLWLVLIEAMLMLTFDLGYTGWSVYPFVVFAALGGFLIYLAVNASAREMMARKLFF